ncbi:hypothetical protein V8Z74_15090 [Comamonas sp. w2-DMI]|uniref:hypothetical protein n=1 Tax=Comamonas sp. w2-DMI TaxID=3126391 RepID=UPI0032E3E0FA
MNAFDKIEDIYYSTRFLFFRDSFYFDLADALRRDVSLKDFARREIENGKILKDETRVRVGKKLIRTIENDDSVGLVASLKCVTPKGDWPMLRAAEASNDVENSISHIGNVVAFRIRILMLVSGMALMLAFIVGMSGGISVLTADTINQIEKSTNQIKFSGFNQFTVLLSRFIMDYWHVCALAIAAIVGMLVYFAPRYIGVLRQKIDEWPILGLYRDLKSANAIATLSMFLSSGLVLKKAIISLTEDDNPWRKWQIQKIVQSLDTQPEELMKAFSRGLFSARLRSRLASLSDSASAFEDAIISLGRDELENIEKQIKKTLIAAGSTITFFVASVAVILSLGTQTIISFVYNELSKGY